MHDTCLCYILHEKVRCIIPDWKFQLSPLMCQLADRQHRLSSEKGRGELEGVDILIVQDLLKFGNSSREYVLLHENAAEEG